MTKPPKILIIDDVTDSRALVVRTVLRKFPSALVQECQEGATAIIAAAAENYDIIVAHRAVDIDGLTLVRMLRKVKPDVPILMISGIDRTRAAREAGATRFHNYDEWLRIGTVIAEMLTPLPNWGDTASLLASRKDPDDQTTAGVGAT
ncbi:MAG TPA: response regulator [Opitutaceae bacterium]|nr:response regulator [Opitutaceae bacterium]